MEKLKKVLNKNIKDETATYAILLAMCITVMATIGISIFVQQGQNIPTASFGIAENNDEIEETIENLTSIEGINSIEELQKLNEKELEEAQKKEEKDDKKNEIKEENKYYIKVNYKAQVVTVYTRDSNGKFTKPVKAMVCSTGTHTPTSGVYKTPYRYRWLRMIGGVYSQYCTQIVGDILFHSVPYLERGNHASLEYWAYDKLGTRASLGCIRLTCIDAKWIYDNCKLGTQVEFYASSNPGPLGKPTARKISSAPASIRGWDPTDPAKGNPWPAYLKEQANKENNNKNDSTNKENNKEDSNQTQNPEQGTKPNPDTDTDEGTNPDTGVGENPKPNPDIDEGTNSDTDSDTDEGEKPNPDTDDKTNSDTNSDKEDGTNEDLN